MVEVAAVVDGDGSTDGVDGEGGIAVAVGAAVARSHRKVQRSIPAGNHCADEGVGRTILSQSERGGVHSDSARVPEDLDRVIAA